MKKNPEFALFDGEVPKMPDNVDTLLHYWINVFLPDGELRDLFMEEKPYYNKDELSQNFFNLGVYLAKKVQEHRHKFTKPEFAKLKNLAVDVFQIGAGITGNWGRNTRDFTLIVQQSVDEEAALLFALGKQLSAKLLSKEYVVVDRLLRIIFRSYLEYKSNADSDISFTDIPVLIEKTKQLANPDILDILMRVQYESRGVILENLQIENSETGERVLLADVLGVMETRERLEQAKDDPELTRQIKEEYIARVHATTTANLIYTEGMYLASSLHESNEANCLSATNLANVYLEAVGIETIAVAFSKHIALIATPDSYEHLYFLEMTNGETPVQDVTSIHEIAGVEEFIQYLRSGDGECFAIVYPGDEHFFVGDDEVCAIFSKFDTGITDGYLISMANFMFLRQVYTAAVPKLRKELGLPRIVGSDVLL